MISADLKTVACAGGLAALMLILTGCGTEYLRRADTMTTYSGDAVRRNIAIQTINPNPSHAYRNHIHHSGTRLEGAMARYNGGGTQAGQDGDMQQSAELQPDAPPPGEPQ